MAINIIERAVTPYNSSASKISNKEQYSLYAPVAGINKPGMAGYSPKYFTVNEQIVKLSTAFLNGILYHIVTDDNTDVDGIKETNTIYSNFTHEVVDRYDIKTDEVVITTVTGSLLVLRNNDFITEVLFADGRMWTRKLSVDGSTIQHTTRFEPVQYGTHFDLHNFVTLDELTDALKDKVDVKDVADYAEQLNIYLEQLRTALSTKSKAYIYSSFEDFINELVRESTYETPNINIGDTAFMFSTGTPDFVVIDNDNHGAYPPDTVLIPNTSNIPTLTAGAICLVANKFLLLAIESGVASADLTLDSELDINSSHAVMNSAITAAIQNLYTYFSGYTAKVDENIERINGLDSRVDTVESIAKGANKAVSFPSYYEMLYELNSLPGDIFRIGQNIYIERLNVPDLWVSKVRDYSVDWDYTTVSEEEIVNALKPPEEGGQGSIQVGYYVLSALETQKVDLTEYPTNDDIKSEFKKFSEGYDIYLNNTFATKDAISGKLDKISESGTRIYTSANGTPSSIVYTDSIVTNTIPIRRDNNNFRVGTPKKDDECANKKYVDDAVGDIDTALDTILDIQEDLLDGVEIASTKYRVIADVTLAEDTQFLEVTQDTDGVDLNLKKFFVLLLGKCVNASSGAFKVDGDNGSRYFCYLGTTLSNTTQKGFWLSAERLEIDEKVDNLTMWRSIYTKTSLGNFLADGSFYAQGLDANNADIRSDFSAVDTSNTIKKLRIGYHTDANALAAGTRILVLGVDDN